MDAETIIGILGLQAHPEGGHYVETWRGGAIGVDVGRGGGRAAGSCIYFLLRAGEVSAWHRVDADEVFHHYAGAPLLLSMAPGSGAGGAIERVLGPDLEAGQRPQIRVPAGDWQSGRSLGEWTLVGCTVSPAFEFAGFEMAPAGWEPGSS